ncbi:MAG: hypothetical protein U5J98_01005 [Halobacteriales archaeon]|nr:hypothetical protein [Halobacteriales archaeon]
MVRSTDIPEPPDAEILAFPTTFDAGATVLLAGNVDPTVYALGLRALCQYSVAEDNAVVVTTTEGADETLETFKSVCPTDDRPSIGIVDATSEEQFVSAVYDTSPVVFTPSDLERIVMALAEITGHRVPANGTRHLVVRSLTPLLRDSPTDAICNVMGRISGLRAGTGLGLFGLDYTQHDGATMSKLAERVEYILWVTHGQGSGLEFELQTARASLSGTVTGSRPGD